MKRELKELLFKEVLRFKGSKDLFEICRVIGITEKVAHSEVPYIFLSVAMKSMETVDKTITLNQKILDRDEIVALASNQISICERELNISLSKNDSVKTMHYTKMLTLLIEKYTKLEGMNMSEKFQIDDKRSIDLAKLDIEELKFLNKILDKTNSDLEVNVEVEDINIDLEVNE